MELLVQSLKSSRVSGHNHCPRLFRVNVTAKVSDSHYCKLGKRGLGQASIRFMLIISLHAAVLALFTIFLFFLLLPFVSTSLR
jgi:hypothetical protein